MSVSTLFAGGRGPRIAARATLPSRHGDFRIVAFEGLCDGKEHIAIHRGPLEGGHDVLARMHSECLTGDALASLRCDCREQLELSLQRVAEQDVGLVLYMRQEGRGIGLCNKIRSYELQDQGLDTVEANHALGFRDDERDYAAAAEMLACLGIHSVRLMTNNPNKVDQLTRYGVQVSERVPHEIVAGDFNRSYLDTKRRRSGHLLTGRIADDA